MLKVSGFKAHQDCHLHKAHGSVGSRISRLQHRSQQGPPLHVPPPGSEDKLGTGPQGLVPLRGECPGSVPREGAGGKAEQMKALTHFVLQSAC